uniref:Uncharacterized protein n=1 Tax=Knipowitschia caucasica TaxID=637954 RepID=A0AAV2J2K4_KNICA
MSGFLQITPEGSPRAERRGEVGGHGDIQGSFCFHGEGVTTTQYMFEEHNTSGISTQSWGNEGDTSVRSHSQHMFTEKLGAVECPEGHVTLQSHTTITRHTAQTESQTARPCTPTEESGP